MPRYYKDPFAIVGDKIVVPNPIQGDGSISYTEGFGENYAIDPALPNSLKVPRPQTNDLFFDLTENLQHYQQHGVPNFITTADNGGVPFPYDIWSIVRYDDGGGFDIYQSLVDNNTSLPPDATKWRNLTESLGDSKAVYIENTVFDVSVLDRDVVYWDPIGNVFVGALGDGSASGLLIGMADIPNSRVLLVGEIDGPFYDDSSISFSLLTDTVYYMSNAGRSGHITDSPSNPDILVRLGVARDSNTFIFNPQVLNSERAVKFTSTGTFSVPYNVQQIVVTCVGGGGGGGGGGTENTAVIVPAASGGGGGGGSGQVIIKQTIVVNQLESLDVIIGSSGSGGIGGTGSPSQSGADGLAGSVTQITRGAAVLISAAAGTGGKGSNGIRNTGPSIFTFGGDGGNNGGISGSAPGIMIDTDNGSIPTRTGYGGKGGSGASNYFSENADGGKSGGETANSGKNNTGFGGGGGGGSGVFAPTPGLNSGGNGGDGSDGFLIIEY